MKLFQWEEGRQQTGYERMLLLTGKWPIPFDFYLIRYKVGAFIPPHVDKAEKGEFYREHHRMNLVLKHANSGGEFHCKNTIINHPRFKYFRPDLHEHSVTKVTKGTRYILSFGWLGKAHKKALE